VIPPLARALFYSPVGERLGKLRAKFAGGEGVQGTESAGEVQGK